MEYLQMSQSLSIEIDEGFQRTPPPKDAMTHSNRPHPSTSHLRRCRKSPPPPPAGIEIGVWKQINKTLDAVLNESLPICMFWL
ncbi:uncharacterized protein BKA78DRAFT_323197 [Phyllosticta capitalensis]|uniref:uncharacterized protein n=1 Tax=Phyllosticta capitalensis TaxID=121624 RepID=UPI00312EE75D